jgi:hypothetical protein
VDDATGHLLISPDRFEPGLTNGRIDKIFVNGIEINLSTKGVSFYAEGHENETEWTHLGFSFFNRSMSFSFSIA